ncbi:TrmH family RNA methyltransferase [Candidatus Laterigemmans baculatus]|uniref:TrmH family RNA methyltransferase n=1 Tax=Candidatus Laterigemmans baculatus TaxID=2770505 RepID=UPI0013DC6732|nr:TrmH family RNA methyltransferase [Candidatus Laterigemmans baculatus]
MQSLSITSAANPRFRAAVRLRQGRVRRREGRFLVDGRREISRAIAAGYELLELYVTTDSPSAESLGAIPQLWIELPPSMLDQLAYGDRNEGAVAVFAARHRTLDQLRLPENPLLVVLDRVEKPGNIGAVFRSADAAGASAVLLSDCAGDLFNPNLIRASLGTAFTTPAAQATAAEVRHWLHARGVRMLATRVDAPATLWETDWRAPAAIVIGSEAEGLGPEWAGEGISGVRIPMAGVADSLNASVTAALCLFEATRQRN